MKFYQWRNEKKMSEPITSNSFPENSTWGDSDLLIVALYRLEDGERFDFKGKRMPLEYVTLDLDTANRLRAENAAINMLEANRTPGRFVIRIGEGHQTDAWPVFEKILDTINFRTGGAGK
jgi:hypothetical protein